MNAEEFLLSNGIWNNPNNYIKLLNEYAKLKSVSTRFDDPKFIDNVCLSYRHDFGLLNDKDKMLTRLECKEWMRAIKNNEPY